jgi:hypothetical protein
LKINYFSIEKSHFLSIDYLPTISLVFSKSVEKMIFYTNVQKGAFDGQNIFDGHKDGQNLKKWANSHQNRYSAEISDCEWDSNVTCELWV